MATFSEILDKTDDQIINIYLDWKNNFLTLQKFADHYGLDEIDANYIIELGRNLNEQRATDKQNFILN